MIFALISLQAQDYLISFEGVGAATTISSVKVENLTSGASLTLNGGDNLHLIPALGIDAKPADNMTLQLYPNPMKEQSVLTFCTQQSGNVLISVFDLSGKAVFRLSKLLSRGTHNFRVSGINRGMYLLTITGEDFNYSAKLLSQNTVPDMAGIEYMSSDENSTGKQFKSTSATIDMPYTDGNILNFKGVSGDYSAIVSNVPTGNKTITFPFIACTDSDGNNYATVQIGSGKFAQFWMAENLRVGNAIDSTTISADNGIIEYYCYKDNLNICGEYGGLYRWDEMMNYNGTEGSRGICPNGWHIPTNQEFYDLEIFLGGSSVAGGKLKETGTYHWNANNSGATNETGFTALPGGFLQSWGPTYDLLGIRATFWSSSPGTVGGYYFYLAVSYLGAASYRSDDQLESAYSVRCLHD